jgi:hypothetical protein
VSSVDAKRELAESALGQLRKARGARGASRAKYAREGLAQRPEDAETRWLLMRQLYIAQLEGGALEKARDVALEMTSVFSEVEDVARFDLARVFLGLHGTTPELSWRSPRRQRPPRANGIIPSRSRGCMALWGDLNEPWPSSTAWAVRSFDSAKIPWSKRLVSCGKPRPGRPPPKKCFSSTIIGFPRPHRCPPWVSFSRVSSSRCWVNPSRRLCSGGSYVLRANFRRWLAWVWLRKSTKPSACSLSQPFDVSDNRSRLWAGLAKPGVFPRVYPVLRVQRVP